MPSSASGGWENDEVLVGRKLNTDSIFAPSTKSTRKTHVCPFCGCVGESAEKPCPQCTLDDTPATRQATRAKIGPWYVLQSRNPAAPGMNYETLMALVKKGRITQRSVVRGPTTHQLWKHAARVRGLSREMGLCWGCGQAIDAATAACPQCGRSQEPPLNPNELLERRPAADSPAPEPLPQPALASTSTLPAVITTPQRLATVAPRPDEIDPETVRMALATFRLPADYAVGARPRRRRKIVGGLAALLLLAGGALAVAGWIDPSLHDKAVAWWNSTFPNSTIAPPTPAPSIKLDLPEAQPKPPTGIITHDDTPPAVTSNLTQPEVAHDFTPPPLAPAATLPAAPDPIPTATTEMALPAPLPPPPPLDPVVAKQQAMELWGNAIDAEQKKDYASAVRYYMKIKELPESAWPLGLDERLNRTMSKLQP